LLHFAPDNAGSATLNEVKPITMGNYPILNFVKVFNLVFPDRFRHLLRKEGTDSTLILLVCGALVNIPTSRLGLTHFSST
jgi:hypothetical protein